MKRHTGYRVMPFTMNRRMAAASAAVSRRQDTIHTITEVDVTEPRRLIREHAERSGERLSFTAYVVTCFAQAIAEDPSLNSMRKGRRLILLDDVTVAVLVERRIDGAPAARFTNRFAELLASGNAIHDEAGPGRVAQPANAWRGIRTLGTACAMGRDGRSSSTPIPL
jgi:pyruvate/2-oxoglutarate dehydrogenase complex dihydrolipoamide acyltransferase (E2) component